MRKKMTNTRSKLDQVVNEILFREKIVSAIIPLIGLAVSLLYVIYLHKSS